MRSALRSKRVRVIALSVIVVIVLLAGGAALIVSFDPSLFYPSPSSITGLHATRAADPADGIAALGLHADNTGEAQRVYQAMLDLPPRGSGTYSCPLDNGIRITITLAFLHGWPTPFTAVIHVGGCGSVQVSNHDSRFDDSDFARMLAASLGVSEDDLFDPGPQGALDSF